MSNGSDVCQSYEQPVGFGGGLPGCFCAYTMLPSGGDFVMQSDPWVAGARISYRYDDRETVVIR